MLYKKEWFTCHALMHGLFILLWLYWETYSPRWKNTFIHPNGFGEERINGEYFVRAPVCHCTFFLISNPYLLNCWVMKKILVLLELRAPFHLCCCNIHVFIIFNTAWMSINHWKRILSVFQWARSTIFVQVDKCTSLNRRRPRKVSMAATIHLLLPVDTPAYEIRTGLDQ